MPSTASFFRWGLLCLITYFVLTLPRKIDIADPVGNEIKHNTHDMNIAEEHFFLPKIEDKKVTEPRVFLVSINDPPNVTNVQATICACPKVGSTSFYRALYKLTHGKEWDFKGPPFVQTLISRQRWTKTKVIIKREWGNFQRKKVPRSMALIRDPKERILSSWKSKIMCGKGVDLNAQKQMVEELLNLAGLPLNIAKEHIARDNETKPCLDLSTFLQALYQVHSKGKDGLLDAHFRPQHLYCFLHAPPSQWGVVTKIDAPDLACQLMLMLGIQNATESDCAIEKRHGSGGLSKYATLTSRDEAILDAITREEYEVLGPYL